LRQAADSEIIRMTMKIRNNEPIPYFKGTDVMVIPKAELVNSCYTWADQVLVATNRTRKSINTQVRKMKGLSGLPQDGDKIICLSNYWDDISMTGDALVNGTTGTVRNPVGRVKKVPYFFNIPENSIHSIQFDFETEEGSCFSGIEMDEKLIQTGRKAVEDYSVAYRLKSYEKKTGEEFIPKEFDYGYAITTHKAQGSSWPKVLVIEEHFPTIQEEHARHLYTSCTRASSRLVLVR
jgi:exodeoxyribonuclease-5